MARPRKTLTDDQRAQVEALAACLSQAQIADYFGMSQRAFQSLCEREPDVSARYKMGKARAIRDVAKGLLQQALGGDKVAAMFYLKTQAGWRETARVDHTSSDRTMSPGIDASKLSASARAEILALADSEPEGDRGEG